MATTIEPGVLAQIQIDWRDAPKGHKSSVIEKWANIVGVCYQTLYGYMPTNRQRTGERKIEGIEEAARIVAAIKNSPPDHRGVLSTEDAVKIALVNGKIAAEFATTPVGTFDRVIRELGLSTKRRRVEPYQAEYPNEMHHVDASSSDSFYIAKALPGGDFLLKLHKGVKGYKNKPIPVDGLRPWYYGMTDDYSGVHLCRIVAAKGEQSRHNMEFLAWAWWQLGIPSHPDPEKKGRIKGDHGPMMESPEAADFFERLDLIIDPSTPLVKEGHGKIERPWRTLWQKFELPFFAMSDWRKFEITLSELNQQLCTYSARYNERRHRYERKLTRRQAWEKISLHGGMVQLPHDALETIAKSNIERTVGQDGVFWMDNIPYEVKGLHDAKVRVIVGVFDKKVIVQDLADGRKYEVEDFTPNRLGEYKANPETGQQQMRKEAAKLEGITTSIYSAQGQEALQTLKAAPAEPRKVVKIPTRVKEVKKLENPLDTDHYRNIKEAMQDFARLAGFHPLGDERAVVTRLIEEGGLSRRFVAELAGEVNQERVAL